MTATFARKCAAFDNGHVNVGTFTVNYGEYEVAGDRGELTFPHLPPNNWYMVDMFPGHQHQPARVRGPHGPDDAARAPTR